MSNFYKYYKLRNMLKSPIFRATITDSVDGLKVTELFKMNAVRQKGFDDIKLDDFLRCYEHFVEIDYK